ncbi:MAG: Lrp/AsnC family transcriptional regulator, partial [Candidatus Thorarchaeota archaeon]
NQAQILTTYKKNGFRIVPNEPGDTYISPKEMSLLRIMRYHKPTSEKPFPLAQEAIGKKMSPLMRQPAVSKAINKLLLKRAIVGYSIEVDFGMIGLPVKFFVRMKVSPGTAAETAQKLIEMDEVWDLYRTSEDYSLLATVRTKSINSFNTFLRDLYGIENIIDTHSSVSLEEWPLRSN